MKRFFLAAAAAVGCWMAGGTAQADGLPPAGPVQGVVSGNCGGGGCADAGVGYARHDPKYGWHPLLRKLAFWKHDNGCGSGSTGIRGRLAGLFHRGGGCGAGGCAGGAGIGGHGHGGDGFNPYPNGTPGTLVFPQHWYARSPRDFFMGDGR